jgi:Skp family chaperone for outer membrane proteins
VLGFTKLAELVGINRDDFAKYLEIFAPTALNESFNADVPLLTDATPAAAVTPAEGQSSAAKLRSSPAGSLYVAFYLVPAIFAVGTAAAVLWVASSTINGISASLVDERKMITANLQEETKAVAAERSKLNDDFWDAQKKNQEETADERKVVNEQLAAFASRLAETNQKRDEVLDQGHKALFDAQMAFIGQTAAGSKERDAAVVEFVKGHLAPPGPAVENDHGPPQPDYMCNLDRDEMGRLQRALFDQSLFSGRIDGLYGPIIGDALQRYQLKENLAVTRQPDKATLDKLGFICNPVPFPSTTRAALAR